MRILFELTLIGSTFTLILVLLKSPLIRKFGGSWYYYIWIPVLFAFCFPYKIDIFKYFTNLIPKTAVLYTASDSFIRNNVYQGISAEIDRNNTLINTENAAQYINECLLILYIIGLLIFLLYYIGLYISFRQRIKKSGKEIVNEQYKLCMKNVCSEMGINNEILFLESNTIKVPMFTGIFKPAIVIPAEEFEINELRLILKHELTHFKRKDMVYKTLALAVHIVHWFNPISCITVRIINEACEYSCDETVTKYMNCDERKKYGYMLLNQIKYSSERSTFAAMFSKNSKSILKRRFEIIMNNKKYNYFKVTAAFICAFLLFSNFFELNTIDTFAKGSSAVYEEDTVINSTELNKTENLDKISEEQAVEMAKAAIKKYYDIDTDSLITDITYIEEGSGSVQPVGWFIRLFPDDANKTCDYAAWIDPEGTKLTVSVSGLWENTEIIGEDSISTIQSDNKLEEKVEEISGEPKGSIKNVYVANLEKSIGEKMYNVNYELEDGSIYTATLTYPEKELKSISMPIK